jgi:integration host factor subunit beta
METFIKRDLISRVQAKTGERKGLTAKMVDATFEAMREILTGAGPECRIEIRDFGVFEVKKTKAKPRARNPRTNETVFVPARRKCQFKPGRNLKSFLHEPLPTTDKD